MLKAATSYLQTQVTTTTPGDLLIMLYDACLKNLRQAQDRIRERNYRDKGMLISKAIDIISELQSSLNAQKGGDLAVNLNKLYFYCNTRLLQANMKMDTAIIDEVVKIISGLRDAFQQVVTQQTNGQPAAAAQPKAPAAQPAAQPKPAPVLRIAPAVAADAAAKATPAQPAAPQDVPAMPEPAIPTSGPNQRAFAAYATARNRTA